MRAMVILAPGTPLQMLERADPTPGDGKICVKVSAYGVFQTDLYAVDAELPCIRYPIVPDHEIVGRRVTTHRIGDRDGISWLGYPCGGCPCCMEGLDFLKIFPQAGIRTRTTAFPFNEANDVLTKLRTGQFLSAAAVQPYGSARA